MCSYSGKELYKRYYQYDKNIISYFVDDDPNKIGDNINGIKILSYDQLKFIKKNSN